MTYISQVVTVCMTYISQVVTVCLTYHPKWSQCVTSCLHDFALGRVARVVSCVSHGVTQCATSCSLACTQHVQKELGCIETYVRDLKRRAPATWCLSKEAQHYGDQAVLPQCGDQAVVLCTAMCRPSTALWGPSCAASSLLRAVPQRIDHSLSPQRVTRKK